MIARVVFEMFVVLIYVLCVYQLVVAELLVSLPTIHESVSLSVRLNVRAGVSRF